MVSARHRSLLALLLVVALPAPAHWAPKIVYGQDDRQELHETSSRASLAAAASTVALFQASALQLRKDGLLHVTGKSYGDDQGLCPDERFYDQPAAAFCTGAVVGPDLVITAGHCVKGLKCVDIRLAFGYANLSVDHNPRVLLPDDVMECEEIIPSKGKSALDFAFIRLTRRAPATPLPLASQEPLLREPIILTGHPSGLPMKVVEGATLTRVKEKFINAQVDAFGGNSGSPITAADSGELLGILVEGEEDWVDDKLAGCRRARVCRTGASCGSEKILRISAILKQLGGELPR